MSQRIVGDGNISIYPGQARVGPDPFNNEREEQNFWGWYRGPRGLAGAIRYRCIRRKWSPELHGMFPSAFQDVVMTIHMIAMLREECGLSHLPLETLWMIVEKLDWRDGMDEITDYYCY